jgi:hypothetical protein
LLVSDGDVYEIVSPKSVITFILGKDGQRGQAEVRNQGLTLSSHLLDSRTKTVRDLLGSASVLTVSSLLESHIDTLKSGVAMSKVEEAVD